MTARQDRGFIDRCITDLVRAWALTPGQYRQLGRLCAADIPSFERCCVVRDAVGWAKRLGWQVEASRVQGYRITGFQHPQRLYLSKPGRRAADD